MSGYRDGMSDAAVILDAMQRVAALTRGTSHPSKPVLVAYLRHAGRSTLVDVLATQTAIGTPGVRIARERSGVTLYVYEWSEP